MPNYAYKCKECGREFEKIVKLDEKDRVNCIHCGGAVNRMLASFNIVGGSKPSVTRPGCYGAPEGGGSCPHQGGGG